jgi:hypothetical protein
VRAWYNEPVRFAIPVVAAALLALAAAAGCGDDDEPAAVGTTTTPPAATEATTAPETETQPEPPPTQSNWAAEVDAACEPIQSQIDALPPPTDAASLESWVAQALPLVREEVAAVKTVEPPPAGDEQAEDAALFVDSLERLEDALTHYLAGLRDDNPAATEQALADANAAGAQARTSAGALGVTQCGGYVGS